MVIIYGSDYSGHSNQTDEDIDVQLWKSLVGFFAITKCKLLSLFWVLLSVIDQELFLLHFYSLVMSFPCSCS
ncbi:hypothetical protein PRUPE_6G170000 [Prunus persica]|uniref:Uncharacterized protein n=1 Tax=Prunus persica TaxID=3760 RepID=A0A251NRN0_PRUPE|nr:hypothetical protein PRUPE_6G170000 [Prunus persica]